MVIRCPACQAQYKIDPSASKRAEARVQCPGFAHRFTVQLTDHPTDQQPSETPRILIVDDARFFREMIRDILQDLPVEIVTAADGDAAWQQIVSDPPELMLLDLNIPGRSGWQILQGLREDARLKNVRVLAMSGIERGEKAAQEVRAMGAADFLNKSFKPRDLQNRVETLLGL